MTSQIGLGHTQSRQNLDFENFYSGIKQILGVLLEGVTNPEATPQEEVRFSLSQLFEPFYSLKKFDQNLPVDEVCQSVSQIIAGLKSEHIKLIRSGINSDGFRQVVENLYLGLQSAFDAVLATLPESANHPLKVFLSRSDAYSVLGEIYGATILVLAGAWLNGEEDFKIISSSGEQQKFKIKGCCVPLVRILLEEFLGINHQFLGPKTVEHIEAAATILGATKPQATC